MPALGAFEPIGNAPPTLAELTAFRISAILGPRERPAIGSGRVATIVALRCSNGQGNR
jgi:hypothetical protein